MSIFDMLSGKGGLSEMKEKLSVSREEASQIITQYEADGILLEIRGSNTIEKFELTEGFTTLDKAEQENRLKAVLNAALDTAGTTVKQKMSDSISENLPNIPGLDLGSIIGKMM
ncbi:MAG: hypothetical protein SGJ04_10145 [Bacteroidota bacterium]|nr:hypothetical protein [Bacteroidota bacterium]